MGAPPDASKEPVTDVPPDDPEALLEQHRFRGGVCIDCNRSRDTVMSEQLVCARPDTGMSLPKVANLKSRWLIGPAVVPAAALLAFAAMAPLAALMMLFWWFLITVVTVVLWVRRIHRRVPEPRPGFFQSAVLVSAPLIAVNCLLVGLLIEPVLSLSERKGPWKVSEGHVWGGPGRRSITKSRRVDSANAYFTVAGFEVETVWKTASGRQLNPREIVASVKDYLAATGVRGQAPGAGAFVNGVEMKAPDFKFCIVSVDPTVVLMVPFAYDHEAGSLIEMRGYPDQFSRQDPEWGYRMAHNGFMVDDIFLGTDFPFIEGTRWFDPSSKRKAASLEFDGRGTATVDVDAARLQFLRRGERLYVERLQ